MEYEPGLMWLSGLGEVNYHTLADFRSQHESELKVLLAQLLGLLSSKGIISLDLVAHDGTKVRAQAAGDSFRRKGTLAREAAKAAEMMDAIERDESTGANRRRQAARERAARERQQRMKAAAEELRKVRESRKKGKDQARVSLTEPEARVMKHGDAAIAPSYNVQLSTDADSGIVVGVQVTQSASDGALLASAIDEVQRTFGHYPKRVVADGGFTNYPALVAMQERKLDFYGSLSTPAARQAAAMKAAKIDPAFGPAAFKHEAEQRSLQCPAGRMLVYVGHSTKRHAPYQ
jgi:hypothetical protein